MHFEGNDDLLISIVIPTFRREHLLPALFDNLKMQFSGSRVRIEVVLVDNTPERSAYHENLPDFVRYVHEPMAGVAHARNTGVESAAGNYIIFLDDDQVPHPGWLEAMSAAARAGADACFGAIEPRFESPPPPALRQPLERIFSRQISVSSGSDVSEMRAYLGTGNSLFKRSSLNLVNPPFDTAFDRGGEDVWLFRKLVDDHGITFIWIPEALVSEVVPAKRCTQRFVFDRRFSDGQLRTLVESGAGGVKGFSKVLFWMSAGAVQLTLGSIAAIITKPFSDILFQRFALAAAGGAGKLLWVKRKF